MTVAIYRLLCVVDYKGTPFPNKTNLKILPDNWGLPNTVDPVRKTKLWESQRRNLAPGEGTPNQLSFASPRTVVPPLQWGRKANLGTRSNLLREWQNGKIALPGLIFLQQRLLAKAKKVNPALFQF